MAVKELSDKGPDGTRLGQATSDLIAFHGSTPISQRASASLSATLSNFAHTGASLVAAQTLSAGYAGLVDAVTEIRAMLVAYGLHKGGA
jgi:hypothetical protein